MFDGDYNLHISDVVFIVLLILKLTKLIDYSWWWVFSPILICLGIIVIRAIYITIQEWINDYDGDY